MTWEKYVIQAAQNINILYYLVNVLAKNATYQIVLSYLRSYSCGVWFEAFLMSIPTTTLNLPVHTYPYP